MAFGQYQITTSPGNSRSSDDDGNPVAFGRLLTGPTHTFTGGLRFGLGGARESVKTGGYEVSRTARQADTRRAAQERCPSCFRLAADRHPSRRSCPPASLPDTCGFPATTNRSGQSAALVMPMRGVVSDIERQGHRRGPHHDV